MGPSTSAAAAAALQKGVLYDRSVYPFFVVSENFDLFTDAS